MTEWNASEYDRLSALQDTMAAEVLSSLTLKGNERILDIGCGNGKTTAAIAERIPQGSVLGVDASAEMVAFANEHWTASPSQPPIRRRRCPAPPVPARIRPRRLLQRPALDLRSGIALAGNPPGAQIGRQSSAAHGHQGRTHLHRGCHRGNPQIASLGRLLQGFPRSLHAPHARAVRRPRRTAGFPRPQYPHIGQSLGLRLPRRVPRAHESHHDRVDAAPAGSRPRRLYQRRRSITTRK